MHFSLYDAKIVFPEQLTNGSILVLIGALSEEVSYLPNIKSAAKRDALSKAKYLVNKANKSALKTTIKRFDLAVSDGDKEMAATAYKAAVKSIDHAARKNLIHKNYAARKKSRLTTSLNSMTN